MDIKKIYKQLTNVDIEEQKQLWDERGKGYYGEFLVFCDLYKNISGNCKILMNLNVPTEQENTTEIDLVLIHETGIYVFEIKHYKGTIYGDDTGNIWTQYFRTVKNNTFKNPILQNAYHIRALKNIFRDIPIKSVIVFTNRDCDLRITNSNPDIDICTLYNLTKTLQYNFKNSDFKLSTEEIDGIFGILSKYSQMQEVIPYDGKEESFLSWLQPTLIKLEEEKNNLNNQIIQNKKNAIKASIINAIVIVGCITITIISINVIGSNYNKKIEIAQQNFNRDLNDAKQNYNTELRKAQQNYNTELEKFKQNFKHVDEIDNEYIAALNEYFSVSNISLNENTNNSVAFTAKISSSNDTYGMALTENSRYIVMTSSGMVYEYNVFGSHLSYSRYNNMIGKGIRDSGNLAKIQFNGVSKNEITYIKITNIELFKLDTSRTLIEKNLELELYSK